MTGEHNEPGGNPDPARLEDRTAIRDVVSRYCRGVDRLELDLVRGVYHPDGVDHHTGFDGPADQYVAWLDKVLRRLDGTMHIIANQLIEFAASRAVVETYGMAVHWGTPADDPGRNFTSGFRYVDLMEERSGRWGIVERYAVREWTRSDAGQRIPREAPGPSGRRDTEDPVYLLRKLL